MPSPRRHLPSAAPALRHGHLAGATGLIGRAVCAQWLNKPTAPGGAAHTSLHLWVRRPLPAGHPALDTSGQVRAGVAVDCVDWAAALQLPPSGADDWALSALGTTLATAGSQAAFRAVDLDAVLAFARAARAAGITRFAAVSALGADAASGNFYNRVKGEAELALQSLGFETLILARPSLLAGDRAALQQAPRRGEQLALTLTRPLARWLPLPIRPITADTVARAMLAALGQRGPGVHVMSSADLQRLGADGDA